ncbi:hypothetical protein MKL09_00820 [Methylobacterium sp. J-048]|uniref:hypothetical protein n=1 Tax=Methylobacterium sp. J-048 TaxID=2836635 RepID=UPI001FBBD835|nr:hypothetical protein [Methylobacterium sp. J-048]MCJ2055099.1 hypothetical protein [Methylobacterium sp. J-048]
MTNAFIPAGTISFGAALARTAEASFSGAWASSKPGERAFLIEGAGSNSFVAHLATSEGTLAGLAYGMLRPLLADGSLPSLLRVPTGSPQSIDPASWQASRADRLNDVLRGTVAFATVGGAPAVGHVLIRNDDLDAVLSGKQAPGANALPNPHLPNPIAQIGPAVGKGGNRPNPEADRFWIEICRIIKEGDIQGGQAGLTVRMAQWATNNMSRPYDAETVRKKVGNLFRSIGWE